MSGGEALLAASVLGAIGSVTQGNAANRAAKFNAQVASNNATSVRQTAAANAAREERQGRKRRGELRAAVGASGITLAGTPIDLLADSAAEDELNRLTILHGGEVQATGFEQTASLELARGRSARSAGFFGAGTSLLLGAAGASKSGVFSGFGAKPGIGTMSHSALKV